MYSLLLFKVNIMLILMILVFNTRQITSFQITTGTSTSRIGCTSTRSLCRMKKNFGFQLLHSQKNSNDDNNNNNDDDNEPIFYNDFDDNDDSTISSSFHNNNNDDDNVDDNIDNKLSELVSKSKEKEIENDVRLSRNWSTGNWKMRGFLLDQFSSSSHDSSDHDRNSSATRTANTATDSATIDNQEKLSQSLSSSSTQSKSVPIHVCKITFDETTLGFHDVTETIAVGRTDGSVYVVQLGSNYMTKFTAVSKEEENGDMDNIRNKDNDDDDVFPVRLVRDDATLENGVLDENYTTQNESLSSTPFEILHQFSTNEDNEPITSLLYHDETLYTASGSSGDIQVWSLDHSLSTTSTTTDDESRNTIVDTIPLLTLKNGHTDKVIAMKTLSNKRGDGNKAVNINDHNLLLTASLDGSFALWSRDDGDLVYRCELLDDDGSPTSITCADVDTSCDEHFIYFGLSSGQIVGYAVSNLVGCASDGKTCPIPSCRFMAHDPSQQKLQHASNRPGVSAITCAGEGTSAMTTRSISDLKSTIILTGGADGIVKQYEILRRKTANNAVGDEIPSWNLEHWPRLPTQRMKRHAHIFKGHNGSVSALASQNGSKVLSAGSDGTLRVWDSAKGEEDYRMDGFDAAISSLCLDREVLVTNGMGGYVCVHDFDVSIDEYEYGFDLDW